jgi:adenylate cyclase
MGSVQRFNYSALGNAVNLASRLEEQTKVYGCPIVVGHETAVAAGDLAFLELDVVRVRGKLQPTRIHALLGDGDLARQPSFLALREAHDALLDAYRDGRIEEALRNLDTCRARRGDLPLRTTYDLYERRLRAGRFEPLGGEAHGHAELREPGTA